MSIHFYPCVQFTLLRDFDWDFVVCAVAFEAARRYDLQDVYIIARRTQVYSDGTSKFRCGNLMEEERLAKKSPAIVP